MKIGIDIDGCITNQEDFLINFGTKFIALNDMPFKIENNDALDSTDIFGWSDEDAHNFWFQNRKFLNYETRPFCSEVIAKLRKEGHQIYIITARHNGDKWWNLKDRDRVEKITKKYLKKFKIKYDYLIFTNNKLDEIIKNKIDVMIEDDIKNIETLSKQIPILVMNSRFNSRYNFNNTIRVYSWYDIYSKINKLKIRRKNERD